MKHLMKSPTNVLLRPGRKYLALGLVALVVLGMALAFPHISHAGPPNGVDHLRGRWDGVVEDLHGTDQPFTLFLNDFEPAQDGSGASVAGGCLAVGEDASFTPVSAYALPLTDDSFDLTLYGTVSYVHGTFIIRLDGLVETFGASVRDDVVGGAWSTGDPGGGWSAFHHDRRRPKCPAVELDGETFRADVYAAVNEHPGGDPSASTLLGASTNLVSLAVRVDLPDGGVLEIPFYTDVFSPNVDFIDSFRFHGDLDGWPVTGGVYTFTLLDPTGRPIEGATTTDTWLACPISAPGNVSASVLSKDINVAWDPVPTAPGFNPGGVQPLGFYQIELGPETGTDGNYGSSGIQSATHLIPWFSFGGDLPGNPDGWDFGSSLAELTDGIYGFDVIAFGEAPPSSVASGLECQIRADEEHVRFEKLGTTIMILP